MRKIGQQVEITDNKKLNRFEKYIIVITYSDLT